MLERDEIDASVFAAVQVQLVALDVRQTLRLLLVTQHGI